MEVIPPSGGGGGGGPAPFLQKTYDMVDDTATDEIVSWSSSRKSFVVWNPPEFARLLLPTYFKHNNFSSFIRQLNTYGFRKIDPERWEFANEDFVKDQKHLLKNIHRRKPIHSHSNPQGTASVDSERAAFEEEIEKLSREKATLENNLLMLKQQQSAAKHQLEDATLLVSSMEQRQENLLTYLEKALRNQNFIEQLGRKLEAMDFSAYNKKRRLPQADNSLQVPENSFVDNHSSTRPEFGNISCPDFSNKLTLELSPAASDINFVSHSTQSSNEDNVGSPQKGPTEGNSKASQAAAGGVFFAPEMLELSDTGTSFTFQMDSNPRLRPLQENLTSNEETDALISCHLNLTLASSPLQVTAQQCNEIGKSMESTRPDDTVKESDLMVCPRSVAFSDEDANLSSSQEEPVKNQGTAAPPVRVNDMFWEQFLTERPGCSETEEASSSYKGNACDDQEDKRSGHLMSRNAKGIENLTL